MLAGVLGGGWLVTGLAAYYFFRRSDKRGKKITRLEQYIKNLEKNNEIIEGSLNDSANADVDSVRDKYTS